MTDQVDLYREAHMTGLETQCLNEKCNTHLPYAKYELQQTRLDLDNDKYVTVLKGCAQSSHVCMTVSEAFMPHQDTQAVDVWFTSSTKVCVVTFPEFPELLVRRLHKKRVSGSCQRLPKDLNYTDCLN